MLAGSVQVDEMIPAVELEAGVFLDDHGRKWLHMPSAARSSPEAKMNRPTSLAITHTLTCSGTKHYTPKDSRPGFCDDWAVRSKGSHGRPIDSRVNARSSQHHPRGKRAQERPDNVRTDLRKESLQKKSCTFRQEHPGRNINEKSLGKQATSRGGAGER